jgi:hypothetical protein
MFIYMSIAYILNTKDSEDMVIFKLLFELLTLIN